MSQSINNPSSYSYISDDDNNNNNMIDDAPTNAKTTTTATTNERPTAEDPQSPLPSSSFFVLSLINHIKECTG